MRRVVVSGLGAVTPLGLDMTRSFERLVAGEGAIGPAPDSIRKWYPDAVVAAVPDEFDRQLTRMERSLDRATQFALVASRAAMLDADLQLDESEKDRAGVYSGIGMGGACTLDNVYARFYSRLHKVDGESGDPALVHPFTVPMAMSNSAVAWLSIFNGFRGPTQTFSVACASSAVALGEAYRAIKHGYADVIVVVGTEAMLVPGPYFAWNALRVMAPAHPTDLAASCRPFSLDRNGFSLGEGACALVLETADRALARGQRAYGEIVGYGTSSDATHITLPSSEGQARAMGMALEEASCPPEAVGYINAHGTATEAGDISETRAIKQVFGSHAGNIPVSSTKSMHGHLIGAGGALEFAIALMAMRQQVIPPTAYLTAADPNCDLDYVPNVARRVADLDVVMSNSFAFGGTNASLLARAMPGPETAG